jgi:hypothetical protein
MSVGARYSSMRWVLVVLRRLARRYNVDFDNAVESSAKSVGAMKRPDWTYGWFYRLKSRTLHRFDLHHTRTSYVEDGATVTRCDWCGLSQSRRPMSEVLRDLNGSPPTKVREPASPS